MTVTKDYLREHFDDLVAVPDGQQVNIVRDRAGVHLNFVPLSQEPSRNTLWGAMREEYLRGEIRMADDFNSAETNQLIEDMFFPAGE